MQTNTITHKCGHQQQHVLDGGKADRERQQTLLAAQACGDCRRQARERRQERAAAWLRTQGLPPLTGTPRQVAEAEQVRWETLSGAPLQEAARNAAAILRGADPAALPGPLRRLLAQESARAAMRELAAYTEEVLAGLRAETSAAWWMARRRGAAWAEVEHKLQRKLHALMGALRSAA